jgi:integrase
MPVRRGGQFRNGVRKEANGSFTAKYNTLWSKGHPTRQAAIEARGELAKQGKQKREGRETVAEWGDRWLKVKPRPAETSNIYYRERSSLFVQEHGAKRLSDITPEDCQRFQLEHPARAKAVRMMFTDAVELGADRLDRSPWQKVRQPRGQDDRKRVHPLTRQEVDRLAEISGERWGEWGKLVYGPMLLMAAWTGMRPAELFAVEWRDIDWERATVHVRRQFRSKSRELVQHTKNGRDRVVPLAPRLVEALRGVPRAREHLFYTARDLSRMAQHSNMRAWVPVRDLFTAELDEGHWLRQRIRDKGKPGVLDAVELRHFFASELYRRHVHIGDIAKMLGHSDEGELARTTYVLVSPDEAQDRVRAALWGSGPGEATREAL